VEPSINLIPVSTRIGVQVTGIDLRRPLSEAMAAEFRRAFDDYHLVVFRGQDLTPADQVRVVSIFGPVLDEELDGSGFSMVSNVAENSVVRRTEQLHFHADYTFTPYPLDGLALYAVEISGQNCPTSFASLADAYQALPTRLKRQIEGLTAIHMADFDSPSGASHVPIRKTSVTAGLDPGRYLSQRWPVVRTHPRTGAELLYVSDYVTLMIEGVPRSESDQLIDELVSYIAAPGNVYRHDWRIGDLVVWDNYALMHGRPPIPSGAIRALRRTSISDVTMRTRFSENAPPLRRRSGRFQDR
jgi:taurine dioxygenase